MFGERIVFLNASCKLDTLDSNLWVEASAWLGEFMQRVMHTQDVN
jgi:hypothetical protein